MPLTAASDSDNDTGCKWLGNGDAFSWSCFIDSAHQGRGCGKSAAQLAISILKAADPEKAIKLSTEMCKQGRRNSTYRSVSGSPTKRTAMTLFSGFDIDK